MKEVRLTPEGQGQQQLERVVAAYKTEKQRALKGFGDFVTLLQKLRGRCSPGRTTIPNSDGTFNLYASQGEWLLCQTRIEDSWDGYFPYGRMSRRLEIHFDQKGHPDSIRVYDLKRLNEERPPESRALQKKYFRDYLLVRPPQLAGEIRDLTRLLTTLIAPFVKPFIKDRSLE